MGGGFWARVGWCLGIKPSGESHSYDIRSFWIKAPARECCYSVLFTLAVVNQLYIQANVDRQGALTWRSIAEKIENKKIGDALDACSQIEEVSAEYLDTI